MTQRSRAPETAQRLRPALASPVRRRQYPSQLILLGDLRMKRGAQLLHALVIPVLGVRGLVRVCRRVCDGLGRRRPEHRACAPLRSRGERGLLAERGSAYSVCTQQGSCQLTPVCT